MDLDYLFPRSSVFGNARADGIGLALIILFGLLVVLAFGIVVFSSSSRRPISPDQDLEREPLVPSETPDQQPR